MKTRVWILALVMAAVSAVGFAQRQVVETIERIDRPANGPRTVADAVGFIHPRVRASVITVDWSTDSFIIPVAGNTPGSGGTFFKSDVVFNNDRLAAQRIAVGWLQQGANNCSAPVQYFNLPANSVTVLDDFVGNTLGKTGLGAILVISVDAAGNYDENGEIDGYSRIWTPQPGSAGTVSQNFQAISTEDSLGSLEATLMGLKQSSAFRTNVGVVNLDTAGAHTWTFTSIFNGNVTSLTVQPCSVSQAGAAANSASASGNLAFTVKSDGFGFWWSGFGSSSDNVTGDGWVARAIQ
jgi:hypothetical protein